MRSFPFRV